MKKIILMIMTIIFLSLFVYSSIHIFNWYKENNHTDDIMDEILEDIQIEEPINEIDNTEIKNEEEKKETKINFNKLIKKNKETKGWIKVNGTNINYPFVQSKDNKYYLTHSFDKKYSTAGWVFLDYRNDINNQSKNTIIYAHSRLDKTMYGTLKYTLKSNWQKKKDNQIITLTTTDNTEYKYQVFSTYHIQTEDYYITTKFSSENDFKNFIKTIKNRSNHNYKVDVTPEDYILTLSTCYSDKEKTVLHAKLIK